MLYILSKQGIRNWLIKVVTDDVYGVNYTHYTVTVYEYSKDKTNFWSNLCNSYSALCTINLGIILFLTNLKHFNHTIASKIHPFSWDKLVESYTV